MAKKVSKAEFKHAMSRRMVDISQTRFDEGAKRVRGPKGKLLTGAVDLGGGKTATYEKGRRLKVDSSKKGFAGAPRSRSGGSAGGTTGGTTTTPTGGSRISGSDAIARALTNKSYSASNPSTNPTKGIIFSSSGRGPSESGLRRARQRAQGRTIGQKNLERRLTERVGFGKPSSLSLKGKTEGEKKLTQLVYKTQGYMRGTGGRSLSDLKKKRATDTRNQERDAVAIASIPVIAAGLITGGGALAGTARLGAAAVRSQQVAARAAQIRASAQARAKAPAAPRSAPASAPKSATPFKEGMKSIGAKQNKGPGFSVKGQILKNKKPVTFGPKKPTAAQVSAARRSASAKKAAETRKKNAEAAARAAGRGQKKRSK